MSTHIAVCEDNIKYINNVKLFLFALSTEENAPDRIIIRNEYGFSRLADLKGKKIGYVNSRSIKVNLELIFKSNHFNLSEFYFLPLSMEEHIDALKQGVVDAIYTYEPYSTILIEAGAKVLMNKPSMCISNPYPAGAFGVNVKYFEKSYNDFLNIYKIFKKSINLIKANKQQALKSLIPFIDINKGLTNNCIIYEWTVANDINKPLIGTINSYFKKLLEFDYIKKEHNIEKYLINLKR